MDNLPNKKYGVIYADPPWLFKTRSDKGKDKSPERHYPVLSLADICNLPVSDIAKPDSVLLMWVCDPMLDQAFKVIDAWGFKYKTVGFIFDKLQKKDNYSDLTINDIRSICTKLCDIPLPLDLHGSCIKLLLYK